MENKEFTVEESTEEVTENFSAEEDKVEQNYTEENQESTEVEDNASFEKKDDEDSTSDDKEDDVDKKPETKNVCSDDDDDDDKKKDDKYNLLEEQYNQLEQKYTEMEATYQELLSFKKAIENEKKDQMINKFYMLSDEDKKDVIDHKDEYTLDQIESKLSVVYANKMIASESNENKENINSNSGVVTYQVDSDTVTVPDWIKAVRAIEKEM